MSDRTPSSEPPQAPPKAAPAPPEPRTGFVTMPTELRVFSRADPTARSLADDPAVAAAAARLRSAGRGPDVLYEDLRDAGAHELGEPSANDNRAEHMVVSMPAGLPATATPRAEAVVLAEAVAQAAGAAELAGAGGDAEAEADTEGEVGVTKAHGGSGGGSPWAREAAMANQIAAASIDREALPSATAPSSRPPPSVSHSVRRAPSSRSGERAGERGRKLRAVWIAVIAATAAVVVGVVTLRPTTPPDGPSASAAGTMGTMGTSVGNATGAATVAVIATGASTVEAIATGAVPVATGAVPVATGAAQVPSATPSASVKVAPKATADPYVDAGAVPTNAAPTAVPSTLPAATVVPTAPPTGTTSARPFAPFVVEKDG